MAADSKGQTLAPSHAFSPSQTLFLSLQEKMGLCPSVPTTSGTWDIYGCVLHECYSVTTGDPREIPSPCLTETPSLGFIVMGGIPLSPFCLPGAANLMTQQPPAPHCHHLICEVLSGTGTPQLPGFSICSVQRSQSRLCSCPEPSPAGSRQLGNEA